jgi:hypothetical protein
MDSALAATGLGISGGGFQPQNSFFSSASPGDENLNYSTLSFVSILFIKQLKSTQIHESY